MNWNFKNQVLPIILTLATFLGLSLLLFYVIRFLNLFPIKEKLIPQLRIADILIGITIYLKTSLDFAIFIGNQIKKYSGWKNRIAIEIGTSLGNGFGTYIILCIWTFFKEVPILLVFMIVTASCVLFRLSEDGLNDYLQTTQTKNNILRQILERVHYIILLINKPLAPFIEFILPHLKQKKSKLHSFISLLLFAMSIPFLLGLDDFAGYIPLFSVLNVFGFSIGVFFGHMILNLLLFAFPSFTIYVVKQKAVMIIGSIVFIGIGLWGLIEALNIILRLFFT